MACYYIVISSTHLSNGHFRNIKGVFRGPLSKNGNKTLDYAEKEKTMAKALEDLKANFYCELCDKQYYKHQEFDNHINSYDHAHKQRLKELKQREFARNVASKSRKDEKKQEKALKRLHELAEQRKEVCCAPGSGPMFKSTTVAVEDSFKELSSRPHSQADGKTEQIKTVPCGTGAVKDVPSVGLPSQSRQIEGPYSNNVKKQVYGQKIGFSFSFPKKASVKLESSAAVFCENAEDGSIELSFRQKNRIAPGDCYLPSTAPPEKALNYGETNYSIGTQQEDFTNKSTTAQFQGSDDASVKQCITEPDSDLCALLVYSEDVESHSLSELHTFPKDTNNEEGLTGMENSAESLQNAAVETQSKSSEEVKEDSQMDVSISEENLTPITDISPMDNTDTPVIELDTSESTEKVANMADKNPSWVFTKPSKPFSSVISKDGMTVLQWPSEMLFFTKTEPSLSYCCNPLHFDFKSSRNKAESESSKYKANESHVVRAAVKEPQTDNSCVSTQLLHCDKHNIKSSNGCGNSSIQKGINSVKGNINHQEALLRNNEQSSDRFVTAAGSHAKAKMHKKARKHLKEWTDVGKKDTNKSWKKDRHDFRSRKRRRRRKAMQHFNEMQKEDNRNEIETEKSEEFLKQTECMSGFDDQFGIDTAEQVEPLEESKQSHQNQEQNDSGGNKERDKVGMKKKAAGRINSTAGSETFFNENCTDHEVVLRSSERNLYNPSTEQMNTTGHCTHCCDMPCKENPGIINGRSDQTTSKSCSEENNLHQNGFLKRRHGSQGEQEEPCFKRQLCAKCASPGKDSHGLKRPVNGCNHEKNASVECRRRKRRRKAYNGKQSLVINWKIADGERSLQDVGVEHFSMDSGVETLQIENGLTAVFPNSNENSKSSSNIVIDSLESEKGLVQFPPKGYLANTQVEYIGWTGDSIPAKTEGECNSEIVSSETTLVRETNQKERCGFINEGKNANSAQHVKSNMDKAHEKPSPKNLFEAHFCHYEVQQFRGQSSESFGHRNSFQNSLHRQHQKSNHNFTCHDASISCGNVRSEHIAGPFPASPQGFLFSPEDSDKHTTLHIQAHRRMLHQQTFPSKLKPILQTPPLPMSSPVLHPVHLPQPMSSTSITIQHTILQHHAAAVAASCSFLQPQPPLFPLPRPPLPHLLGVEMCPGSHPAFIPAAQMSMVRPTSLHPATLTFHTLPRSAVFSPMLPPHPAVIPLQTLF
ncbi:Z804A protein, partial [Amia calva]|nr:Z804A protein [Amia calva]